ncbi:hypothetical protein MNBD_GAMMA12-3788 [hydrothermal vent metagenome]|uniref:TETRATRICOPEPTIDE REPEAT FAMILY PROTEIN n=1 Tax=hydrothermal vent metagenome TaxID=652676 RepID=A0A3B0YF79_9ZZZZ
MVFINIRHIFQFLTLTVTISSYFFLFVPTIFAAKASTEYRFDRIKTQASKGNKRAQYRLGLAYTLGIETKVNITMAIYWLGKSANQGYIKAAHKIGVLYYGNLDGRKNYTKAAHWLKTAAKQNYAPSQYHLAKMYFVGKGVSRDLDLALVWSARAGKNGMNTQRQIRQIEHAIIGRTVKTNFKSDTTSIKPHKIEPVSNKTLILAEKNYFKSTKETVVAKLQTKHTTNIKLRHKHHGGHSTKNHIKLIISGNWIFKGKAAVHMPSAINKCTYKNDSISCASSRTSRSTSHYRVDYKVNSIFSNIQRNGEFNLQYRITNLFILPFDSDDPNPHYKIPTTGKLDKSMNLNCKILSNKKIRCESIDKAVIENYVKKVK